MRKIIPVLAISVLLFLSVILFLTVSGPKANAASELTAQQVQQFVASIPEFATFIKKMATDNKLPPIASAVQAQQPDQGYHPTASLVAAMKQVTPADYSALSAVIGKFGFQTPESWATTADSVNLAYTAIKVAQYGKTFLTAIAEVTPEQEAAMPPEQRAQFEGVKTFISLLASVPEESRALVKSYISDLDRAGNLFTAP